MKNRASIQWRGVRAATAFALLLGVCNVASANITLVPYTTEFYRVGGLRMMEFPFRPPTPSETSSVPQASTDTAPVAPTALEDLVIPSIQMSGSAATLAADGFVKNSPDANGVMTGRSAYVAPVAAACPSQPSPTAAQGDHANRLVFDPYPARCGGFDAKPFDFTAHR